MLTNRRALEYVHNLIGELLQVHKDDPENWKNQEIRNISGSQMRIFFLVNSWGEKLINLQFEFREEDIIKEEGEDHALHIA